MKIYRYLSLDPPYNYLVKKNSIYYAIRINFSGINYIDVLYPNGIVKYFPSDTFLNLVSIKISIDKMILNLDESEEVGKEELFKFLTDKNKELRDIIKLILN